MTMKTALKVSLCVLTLLAAGSPTIAQGTQATPAPPRPGVVPLKVEVVLSRFQNDKLIGRSPFTLLVNVPGTGVTGPRTSLRVGVDVPAGTESTTVDGKTTSKPNYRNVGTQIDCSGKTTEDGRYTLELAITDSAVFAANGNDQQVVRADLDVEAAELQMKRLTDLHSKNLTTQQSLDNATIELKRAQSGLAQAKTAAIPSRADQMAFRNFYVQNQLTLKDGQSSQFTSATDKISGEVLKVDVSISSIK